MFDLIWCSRHLCEYDVIIIFRVRGVCIASIYLMDWKLSNLNSCALPTNTRIRSHTISWIKPGDALKMMPKASWQETPDTWNPLKSTQLAHRSDQLLTYIWTLHRVHQRVHSSKRLPQCGGKESEHLKSQRVSWKTNLSLDMTAPESTQTVTRYVNHPSL